MLAKLRARLTYANVVATLALFVALGGSSYAAISVTGKNVKNSSLTGSDIKNSSLTGKDVKNNSLTGSDIKSIRSGDVSDHSLLAKDFKAGQLPQGATGTPGVPGKDATKLFAYVHEGSTPDTSAADLVFGSGVTGVTDPAGNNQYTVSFDRSVRNCAILATEVSSDDGTDYNDAVPFVRLVADLHPNEAKIGFSHGAPATPIDTSFNVAAFC
jgi:hypothetical protein